MKHVTGLHRSSGTSETVDHGDHSVGPHIRKGGKGKGYQTAGELYQHQPRSPGRATGNG